eukprot:223537_1
MSSSEQESDHVNDNENDKENRKSYKRSMPSTFNRDDPHHQYKQRRLHDGEPYDPMRYSNPAMNDQYGNSNVNNPMRYSMGHDPYNSHASDMEYRHQQNSMHSNSGYHRPMHPPKPPPKPHNIDYYQPRNDAQMREMSDMMLATQQMLQSSQQQVQCLTSKVDKLSDIVQNVSKHRGRSDKQEASDSDNIPPSIQEVISADPAKKKKFDEIYENITANYMITTINERDIFDKINPSKGMVQHDWLLRNFKLYGLCKMAAISEFKSILTTHSKTANLKNKLRVKVGELSEVVAHSVFGYRSVAEYLIKPRKWKKVFGDEPGDFKRNVSKKTITNMKSKYVRKPAWFEYDSSYEIPEPQKKEITEQKEDTAAIVQGNTTNTSGSTLDLKNKSDNDNDSKSKK